MFLKEQAMAERRVTTEQVQQSGCSQGSLFRLEAAALTEATTPPFLRACLSARPGERIVLSLRVAIEWDGPDDEPARPAP